MRVAPSVDCGCAEAVDGENTVFLLPGPDGAAVRVGDEDVAELALDLVVVAKLEAVHAADDGAVDVVCAQGLAAQHVWVRRPVVSADHPWVGQHLGECGAVGGGGDEHPREDMFAVCRKNEEW